MNKPINIGLKRPIPTSEKLEWRARFLATLAEVGLQEPIGEMPPGLAIGNSKIGRFGSLFKSVFVWNLPAVSTCPGASQWCKTHCYNADEREDVFPIEEWRNNWAWIFRNADSVSSHIHTQLSLAALPCAVRIHSSGDFFSAEYIQFWHEIILSHPHVRFWAYTRSWTDISLLQQLEDLRLLQNMQLFASWDETMPSPPVDWRLSVVLADPDETFPSLVSSSGIISCPEQLAKVENCASCGYCIDSLDGHIAFTIH